MLHIRGSITILYPVLDTVVSNNARPRKNVSNMVRAKLLFRFEKVAKMASGLSSRSP